MKIFGFDLALTKKEYLPTGSYSDMSRALQGKDLSINLSTFYRMYRIDADIRRCIQEIQQTTGKSGYALRKWVGNRNNYKDIDNPQIDEILRKSFQSLKSEILQHLIISGTVFILKEKNIEGSTISFRVLDTRYMSVVTDSNLIPTKYLYTEKKLGQVTAYTPEEIYCYKDISDIDNPVFGISMLESLVYDVMGDLEASKSNYYFFQNDALPSSLYILQEGLSKEDQKKIVDDIEMQLQGGANKHKNLVSGNIVDIKPITRSHTDMDFMNQKKHKTEKVCATLGVPKIILNYTDGVNYSTSEIQYQKFIENTIRPYERIIEDIFSTLLAEYLGDIELYVVDKHINDLKDKIALGIQGINNGLFTRNEARTFIGYETVDGDDMMNEYTVSSNTILLDTVSAGTPTIQTYE